MSLSELLIKKGLSFATLVIVALILFNASIFFYFYVTHQEERENREVISFLRPKVERLANDIGAAEIASQEYAEGKPDMTLSQYEGLIQSGSRDLDTLIYYLKRLEFNSALTARVDGGISGILNAHEQFISSVQRGDSAAQANNFNLLQYTFRTAGDILSEVTNVQYDNDQASVIPLMIVTQILLLAGIPFLFMSVSQQRKNRDKLVNLNRDIEESNRKYVFDALDEVNYEDTELVKLRLLNNLKRASEFIQQVASGNYAIRWEGITDHNRDANKENIAGELIRMREQMKQVKAQDEMRIWATEGLSMFGELIRKHQDNFEALGDNFISNTVKYLKAKVGGLFILEEDASGTQFLELKACYAYERKKYVSKKIEIGEGLIGQTYLEGQTIHLKEVPNDYLLITSGLGGANPNCLIFVPLKTNERIEGVLELASFNEFKPHEIEFLEKLGELIASSVISVRTAEKTKSLLQVSQQRSEEMRTQEERTRQTMEELYVVQEDMRKVNLEMEEIFRAINTLTATIELDREGRIMKLNNHLSETLGYDLQQLHAKQFVSILSAEHADENNGFDPLWSRLKAGTPQEKTFAFQDREGKVKWLRTGLFPLRGADNDITRVLCFLTDISEIKNKEVEMDRVNKQMEAFRKMLIKILNEIPLKVFLKEYNGKFFVVNDAVSRFHGFDSPEGLIGKSDFDFYDHKDASDWLAAEHKIIETGRTQYINEDGGKILSTVKMPFYIDPLKETGLLGFQMDITELEELRKKVKELQKKK